MMLNPRKGNQTGIVSQLQVKRLHQELANAQQKLEEYEVLIASLYETLEDIQSIACNKCRVQFEELAPANFTVGQTGAMHRSTTMVPQTHSDSRFESGESYRGNVLNGHHAHSHPHSPSLIVNLVDEPSQRRMATPSPDLPSREFRSELSTISSASDHDGQSTYLHAPSSSRPSSSGSNHQERQSIYPSALSSSSASILNHDERQPPLHVPILSIKDEADGWSISLDQRVKPSIDVKLVEVLVYEETVSCVRFSPDGNYLAVGLDSGQTCIHNMKLGEKSCTLAELSSTNLPPERDRLWSMTFSPDGKYLATGHGSAIIRVWDIAKKHVRNIFRHRGGVSGVDFSADGRFVLSAAHDGTVCSWSMRDGSGRLYSCTDGPYYSLRLTPGGRYVAASNYSGELTIVDYRTGREVKWKCHDGPATIASMPNGKGLVTGGWDKTLKFWDLSSLGEIQEGTLEPTETLSLVGHVNKVRGVTILAGGQWIISASEDLTLCVWDSRTGVRQCTIRGHEMDIWWVDANPAGKYFASGGCDGRVAIWRCSGVRL